MADSVNTQMGVKIDEKYEKNSYWKRLLQRYEKRNAELEKRQAALSERIKFMECALPTLFIDSAFKPSASESKTAEANPESAFSQHIIMIIYDTF